MSTLQLILAQVLTQTPGTSAAEAVLVGAGRILAVGRRAELSAQAPQAQVLDHRDLVLTPGLCDAHTHLATYGFTLSQLNLHGTRSVAEVQRRLAERVARTPSGEWIQGGGFLLSELGLSDYPSAADLDAVSPEHPVALYSRDLHLLWVNSRALELAGIHAGTPDPEGGQIVRSRVAGPDSSGLGCLLEHACGLVSRVIPEPDAVAYLAAARAGADDLRARGFVSTHTMAYESPQAALALQELDRRGELGVRVWACLPHSELDSAERLGIGGNGGGGMFQWGGVKFFADGALGSRTAWLHAPGFADGSGTGIALDPPELILERGRRALELGLVPVTHAIGDRANTEVLNVYDQLRPLADARGLPLRIEHAQHLRPEDLPRFRGVVASLQPSHLPADAALIRDLVPHREALSFASRSLLEHGAVLAFGSDAPVTPPSAPVNFAASVTRSGDRGAPLAPGEALTPEQVLWAHTRGPALAAGWADEGWIRPGGRAAFTLWDRLGGAAQALVL
ncbi:amidohydrolase [Deinococcus piscis]|uniref:Amidohydrolase n=1 Tax=Deinococcus piscis TaxID=394230 RepID=A0ABQ3K8S3_9DEIO|nr:amidohydrolase [Deinococcus piscis]GHG07067.1 amidohydrolase [Deinococcus piscis]